MGVGGIASRKNNVARLKLWETGNRGLKKRERDPVDYIRYMEWFRMALMHTKLISALVHI
jgi:hypothetical protein